MAVQFSKYTVKRGDTLSQIALRLYRNAALWPEIAKANKLKQPYLILAGMVLRIPLNAGAAPGARPGFQPIPPGGDKSAALVIFPKLNYSIEEELIIMLPNGQVKLKVTGELTLEKPGTFELNVTREGLQAWKAAHTVGGVSTWGEGKPFSLKDPMSVGIKSEYGGKLASIFSNCSLKYDPKSGRAELTTGLGWKFGDAKYEFKFPACHVFTFPPKAVRTGDVSGTLSFVAEITEKSNLQPQPVPVTVPFSVKLTDTVPKFSKQEQVAVGGALTLAAALAIMVEYAPLLLLAL